MQIRLALSFVFIFVFIIFCLIILTAGTLLSAEAVKDKKSEKRAFSEVERLIYNTPHLKSVKGPISLVYSFQRTSVFGDAFDDTIRLDVRDNGRGITKNISFEFFTKQRRRPYPPLSDVSTNPLLILFFNKDAWDLARRIKAKGTANYLRNRIVDAISKTKRIEMIKVPFKGKKIAAKRITFAPFVLDKNRHHLLHYAGLEYQVTLADDVPGMVYEITSTVPAHKGKVPEHVVKRLKKGGMQALMREAEQVNKLKVADHPLIVERLRFVRMGREG